jgi:hypothetical protein
MIPIAGGVKLNLKPVIALAELGLYVPPPLEGYSGDVSSTPEPPEGLEQAARRTQRTRAGMKKLFKIRAGGGVKILLQDRKRKAVSLLHTPYITDFITVYHHTGLTRKQTN